MSSTKTTGFLKVIGYAVLAAGILAGAWAAVSILKHGHASTNTTQIVPWGLWVALYIYFLGLSEGSFLLSTLVYVFGVKRLASTGPLALMQALGCLLLGGFLILMDLGHPFRTYQIILSMNPTSVMPWMGIFYSAYIIIILAQLYFALRRHFIKYAMEGQRPAWLYSWLSLGSRDLSADGDRKDAKWLKMLGIIGIPVAIIVTGGVGAIFAVAKARPNWFGGLFPIIFLVSALAAGGALLTFLTAAGSRQPYEKKLAVVKQLAMLMIGILCFELLLLFSEILVAFYGNIPHEVAAWQATLFGAYKWVFWVVQIGAGAVVPIIIVAHARWNNSIKWLGTAGLLVCLGILATRINIVLPPQLEPAFPTLTESYHHARFALDYFPSANEWLVGIGAFAIGILGFLLARRFLPLEGEQTLDTCKSGD